MIVNLFEMMEESLKQNSKFKTVKYTIKICNFEVVIMEIQ